MKKAKESRARPLSVFIFLHVPRVQQWFAETETKINARECF